MVLYRKDKFIKINFFVSLVINILAWILFYFRTPVQMEPIILRFNIYVGINLIGPWYEVFYFSAIGLLIILINFLLARWSFKRDRNLAYFLVATATLSQIIILIYGTLLMMVNI